MAAEQPSPQRTALAYVVILNWNGWRDTLACVESCRQLCWPNFRILLVDNASSDGSEAILRERLPDLELLQTGGNLGFAGGNNVGIRHALAQGADFLWLLNNDTLVEPQALGALIAALEQDAAAGMAGSKIYFHEQPQRIWATAGAWRQGHLSLRMRGSFQLDRGQFERPCEVGSLTGCSLLVSAKAIAAIGPMREDYFLYWEDTEWCARAHAAGYRMLFVPDSRIWHKVSASTGRGSFAQFYYTARNGCAFLKRYDPWQLPLFAVYCLLFTGKALLGGNTQPLRGLWRGVCDFLRGCSGPLGPNACERGDVP